MAIQMANAIAKMPVTALWRAKVGSGLFQTNFQLPVPHFLRLFFYSVYFRFGNMQHCQRREHDLHGGLLGKPGSLHARGMLRRVK